MAEGILETGSSVEAGKIWYDASYESSPLTDVFLMYLYPFSSDYQRVRAALGSYEISYAAGTCDAEMGVVTVDFHVFNRMSAPSGTQYKYDFNPFGMYGPMHDIDMHFRWQETIQLSPPAGPVFRERYIQSWLEFFDSGR